MTAKIRKNDKVRLVKDVASIIKSWQMACEDDPKIVPKYLAQVIVDHFAAVVRVKRHP